MSRITDSVAGTDGADGTDGTDGTDDADGRLSVVHEVLSDPRRRHVLAVLGDCEGVTSASDLVDAVADREAADRDPETGEAVGAAGGADADGIDRRRRVELSLRHVHLPKLVESGFVERVTAADADAATVSLTPAGRRAERARQLSVECFHGGPE